MTDPIRSDFQNRRTTNHLAARRSRKAPPQARLRRKKDKRSANQSLHQETLESRLALTISVEPVPGFVNINFTGGGGGFVDGYAVIASDNADDVYLKQVSTAPQDLLVADNSSFLNYQHIDGIDADIALGVGQAFRDVFITNGSPESVASLLPVRTASDTTTFRLGFQFLDRGSDEFFSLTGSISYQQADGATSVWTFENRASPNEARGNVLTILSGPGYPAGQSSSLALGYVRPLSIQYAEGQDMPRGFELGQATITLVWSGPVDPANPPVLTFSAQDTDGLEGGSVTDSTAPLLSNSNVVDFALPDRYNLDSLGVIPGSLEGSIALEVGGRTGRVALPIRALPNGQIMFFQDVIEGGITQVTGWTDLAVIETDGFGDSGSIFVRGSVRGNRLQLSFSEGFGALSAVGKLPTRSNGLGLDTSGFELINGYQRVASAATFARLDARYLVYNRDAQPNEVTFAPGHTFTREPTVDLLTSGSTLIINSPIDVTYEIFNNTPRPAPVGSVDFRVTNIDVNAPVFAPWRVDIGHSQVGDAERLTNFGESQNNITPRNRFRDSPTFSRTYQPSRGQTATAYASVDSTGSVSAAAIVTAGSGYDPAKPPTVTVSPPTANAGSAVVTRISGKVTRVSVTDEGTAYTNGATVTFGAPDTGFLQAVNLNFGGSGYTQAPYVEIVGGGGTGALATATVANGRVTGITITNPGRDFVSAPAIRLVGGGGTGASALAQLGFDQARGDAVVVDGSVVDIAVTNPGTGYNAPPTVTISGVGTGRPGSGATATASISADIATVQVTTPGSNYLGGRSGFIDAVVTSNDVFATFAEVRIPVINGELRNDHVARITVVDGGSGYSSAEPPTVTLRGGPSQTQNIAIARAIVVGGTITEIVIDNPGRFYTSAPQVIISAPSSPAGRTAAAYAEIGQVTFNDRGSGYTQLNGIGVSVPQPVASGTPAQFTAEVSATGFITRLVPVTGKNGSGYSVPPVITIAPPPYQRAAAATAEIGNGGVTQIDVTDQGFRYKSAPRVVIDPPRGLGRPAKATATLDDSGRVTRIKVDDRGSGYTAPPRVRIAIPTPVNHTEQVTVDAELRGQIYELYVSDDFGTDREKGRLRLAEGLSFARRPIDGGAATDLYFEATTADIISEGAIRAARQTYLLNSDEFHDHLAPFTFTTRSPSTNANAATALIEGSAVAITLGNHTPTPFQGSVAFNVVDLKTRIDSFRITAATAKPTPNPAGPFPYAITIDEFDNISIDAVAATSLPISLRAAGAIAFTSAIATAGDFIVNALDVTTQSPVSTTAGRIVLNGGANVTVQNGLRVGPAAATPLNRGRRDIVLTAAGGNMSLAGDIQAPNNVALLQRNTTTAGSRRRTSAPGLALRAGATVSAPLVVADNFRFTDLNVEVNVTHPSTRLLSLTLVAPDGTRVPLVQNVGGRTADTANFTGTVFDEEAATGIAAGTSPFTGNFRPQASLAALYNRSAQGTWRLEATNQFGFLVGAAGTGGAQTPVEGTLNNFTLAFQADGAGVISGTAKIIADGLDIDTQTAIGDASQLPGDPTYFLKTDVNTLSARAGGSIAIDEATAIDVTSLRAGGIVTLRANGVDPLPITASPAVAALRASLTDVAALRASLTDVPALDLSAPNGSIDVRYNSPVQNVVLGNARNLTLSQQAREGKVFSMLAAGKVDIRSSGGSALGERLVVLDGPAAGSGARSVRAAATTALAATYDPRRPGVFASTITAAGNGPLVVAGVRMSVGQRVLVANGTSNTPGAASNANGVYLVVDAGSSTTPWRLVRDADSDTAGEMPSNTFVRVQDGVSAAKFFQVTYADATNFGATPITVSDVTANLKTNIGSDDESDAVQFVVSTPDGTNTSAGSFGKMITLRQTLDTSASPNNPKQESEFAFLSDLIPTGSSAVAIRLSQQLPAIEKAFAIDGANRVTRTGDRAQPGGVIVVDGSLVVQTAGNAVVLPDTIVNGIEFRGKNAAGSTLANLRFGGFASGLASPGTPAGVADRGAGVVVDGVPGMSITSVTVGQSETGSRLQNGYGILVKGNSTDITIGGVTATSSLEAGIAVKDAATGVSIVGSTIGAAQQENRVGVLFDAQGANSLGSAAGARNFVRSNGEGVVLRRGTNTVVNTEVSGNTFDGIRIEGGTNMVGNAPASVAATVFAATVPAASKTARRPAARTAVRTAPPPPPPKGTLSASSNAIFGNGRWGVSIAPTATSVQRVTGNYLGTGLFRSAAVINVSGNIAVNNAPATGADYTPASKTGIDGQNNQHATTTKTVTPPRPRVAFPWRPRR